MNVIPGPCQKIDVLHRVKTCEYSTYTRDTIKALCVAFTCCVKSPQISSLAYAVLQFSHVFQTKSQPQSMWNVFWWMLLFLLIYINNTCHWFSWLARLINHSVFWHHPRHEHFWSDNFHVLFFLCTPHASDLQRSQTVVPNPLPRWWKTKWWNYFWCWLLWKCGVSEEWQRGLVGLHFLEQMQKKCHMTFGTIALSRLSFHTQQSWHLLLPVPSQSMSHGLSQQSPRLLHVPFREMVQQLQVVAEVVLWVVGWEQRLPKWQQQTTTMRTRMWKVLAYDQVCPVLFWTSSSLEPLLWR